MKCKYNGCTGLTSVTIPNSVTSIGREAFDGCTGLTKVTLNSNSIASKTYTSSSNLSAIFGSQVKEYVLGDNITTIGSYAFSGCSGLTSVTIPESVTSIGSRAFEECSGLTKAEFASIESLCKIKFEDSSSNPLYYAEHLYIDGQEVTDVVIPNSITSINAYTFRNCSSLKSVTIPNSVTNIGEDAFAYCTGLTSVTCHAQNVPSTRTSVFYYVPQSTATLYVPAESVEAYKYASPWKDFGTILPITPTAVESLTADEASDTDKDDAIYDLHGRRLQHKPAHGFYIQGGKKYFVK